MTKLRVLVIDDSAYNRQTISDILSSDPNMEVVGKAFDGEEGLKLATQLKPDLITLDIEMPRMDGFTFLRILMSRMPTPVIVISSHTRKQEVFQALELGALDFLAKPAQFIDPDLRALHDELIAKALTVRALEPVPFADRAATKLIASRGRAADTDRLEPIAAGPATRLVCIGASTGGPPALEAVFKGLKPSPSTAFLVVQHMPEKFTRAFAERLDRMSALKIREADNRMSIAAGAVYVAPGGQQMEVERATSGEWVLKLSPPAAEERFVPSIDRMFESAARGFGSAMLAVVLTGMGCDGAVGVKAVHAAKGRVVAESAETAVVFGMPKEAIQTGCVDEVLPLAGVIERIETFNRSGATPAGRAERGA